MRLNKYIAAASELSRRAADVAIAEGRVTINGKIASIGSPAELTDVISLDGVKLVFRQTHTTIILHKPVGYVCSRDGQGSLTVYDLLPPELHLLNPVGRLDKDSSGLLLMTDDGDLANKLTHPRYAKTKVYEITLDKPLQPLHQQIISDHGILLEDGLSRFSIQKLESRVMRHESREEDTPLRGNKNVRQKPDTISTHDSYLLPHDSHAYEVRMQEGRNRQIRRTFAALGYTVTTLHRTHFGPHTLDDLQAGQWKKVA
ncbi:rRNA pseudouridine synthase [Candidatus Saccharibacteria bacterium]|nr:rRNA pseudouridine synthase [Candidatus Saccharibacteria bacterium]